MRIAAWPWCIDSAMTAAHIAPFRIAAARISILGWISTRLFGTPSTALDTLPLHIQAARLGDLTDGHPVVPFHVSLHCLAVAHSISKGTPFHSIFQQA